MMGVDISRCLTMGAYYGLHVIKECRANYPELTQREAISLIRRTNADVAALDFEGAKQAASIIQRRIDFYQNNISIQEFLKILLQETWPWWLRVFPKGRDCVIRVLTTDQLQCFRVAGLLESFPSENAIAWWDEMNAFVRKQEDIDIMIQAREAERLSFEQERQRLKTLGVTCEPRWIALEDNTVGYDILSFNVEGGVKTNRLVEVKSTVSGSIHLTRNEWENAASAGKNYIFHVWRFPDKKFAEFSVISIMEHIPHDKGHGIWKDVEIEVRM